MSVSSLIKRACYLSGLYLGVPHILYTLCRRDVVVMYHSVKTSKSGYEYAVTVKNLLQQINSIKKHFKIVPLHEILQQKAGVRRAALTFDDAFADFYDDAFPVLREKHIHATVFVPTAFIETGRTMIKNKPHLNWEQMRRLQDTSLVDFQSHGHNHQHIRKMSLEELRSDILKSKQIIESHLDCTTDLFAYPGGKFLDWQHEVILDLGFKAVCTSVNRTIRENRKVLPRITVTRDCSAVEFNGLLSGIYEVIYRK
jgi:peptidoglycan/xylan/chitin deacetylase (PgdA/CDA1 family)